MQGREDGAEGARVLAGVLGGCTALIYLDLTGNDCGDGASTVLSVMEELEECKMELHFDAAAW
eukprot:456943-Rhodomonas_salina.2